MDEYCSEITSPAISDRCHGRSRTCSERSVDADRIRNPLAGPSVLGISSGASLGVACVVLLSGSIGGIALSKLGVIGEFTITFSAIVGSLLIMVLIAFVAQKVRGNVTLLIMGVMIGYIANAIIGVLKFF